MKLFSNSRTKRNTVFVVLLVWLFAVASGVANACLLETPGTHSHVATAGASETAHVPAVLAGHAVAVTGHGEGDGHGDDADNTKASCLKVCDDGSKSLVKLQSAFDLTDPGIAPLVAIVWDAETPVVAGPLRLEDLQPPIAGPPFRVRYSRLAL
jgi:hypothetical protein